MKSAFPKVVAAVALIVASLWIGASHAGALLPVRPAPCSWTFGALSTQGAAGTQILQVNLQPASGGMRCIQTVSMTSQITNSAGGVPAGITGDGGPATLTLLFSAGEYPPPAVLVGWRAYCTTVAQPVFLHISGGGQAAIYALGQSRPCSEGPASSSTVDPPRVVIPDPAVGLSAGPGDGYRIVVAGGTVIQQPGAVLEGGGDSAAAFVGMAADPSGGFWLATYDGGVFSLNGARFFGSAFGAKLAAPIVGIVPTPGGLGYWLVGADGGVFSYGDAHFCGSAGAVKLVAPVVGMAPTADGKGYWLVGADGGVFSYGDAHFYGSAGADHLTAPVVGITGDNATGGYWLGAADGGVFSYHAAFHGSAGGTTLDAPVTGITATPNSGGYWLVAGDGGVFTYGNAPYHGTAASLVAP
jgi:hypothetical protein